MAEADNVVPLERTPATGASAVGLLPEDLPGRARRRCDVSPPDAYAIVDVETTGTDPAVDEIVSLAIVRLDADGAETARFATLVRPSQPIPSVKTTGGSPSPSSSTNNRVPSSASTKHSRSYRTPSKLTSWWLRPGCPGCR